MTTSIDTKNMKIVFCSQDNCDQFASGVDLVLRAIGVKSALVTDKSSLSDFLINLAPDDEDVIRHNEDIFENMEKIIGRKPSPNEYIWELARDAENLKQNETATRH